MAKPRALLSLRKLELALGRLADALAQPVDAPLVLDGTIQRFEFVFELAWKTIKLVLADDGVQVTSPREAIKAAFVAGLVTDESAWLGLMQARNETSHTYDEALARRVYGVIKESFGTMELACASIRDRVTADEPD